MDTAFQADAFQNDAFQIFASVPAVDTTPARTAAGGPTGVRHRKRYIFPTPEEIEAQEREVLAQAMKAVPVAVEEADDEEMISALAAFLANEDDLF